MHSYTRTDVVKAALLIIAGALGIQVSSALSSSLFISFGALGTSSLRMMLAAIIMCAVVRPRLSGRSKNEWITIFVYGLAIACMNICLYVAISRLPLGVAVTLEFLGACSVALMASRRAREIACALCALGGVALISLGPGGYFDAVGYAAGLGSAFFLAMYTLFAAKLGKESSGLDSVALSIAVAAIVTLPVSVQEVVHVLPTQWMILGAAALVGAVIPYSVDVVAGKLTSARVIGTLFAVDPALGALIGFVGLGQAITLSAVVGIGLVVVAGALLVWSAG